MTPAARLSAAIELIDTIEKDRVPAAKALKEWGTAHRFAGSGDRAAIAGLVWDVLRRYASSAYLMDSDTARSRLIGMLRLERNMLRLGQRDDLRIGRGELNGRRD
jgi:16S rRNA (cytosine967-C5)-methyltransferase